MELTVGLQVYHFYLLVLFYKRKFISIKAYFMSIDSSGNYVYPFFMGPQYYGVPISQTSTKSAPSETVTYFYNYNSAIRASQISASLMLLLVLFSFLF